MPEIHGHWFLWTILNQIGIKLLFSGLALSQPWLPMGIFGSLAFISGTLVYLFLPETLGRPLPETVAEASNLGSNIAEISTEHDETSPLLN